jgi:hypothetical protein
VVVTAVGPFVFPHVRIRRRAFGQNQPVIATRELVPEASIYDETAPPLESIPIGSTSSFPTIAGDWCPWTILLV